MWGWLPAFDGQTIASTAIGVIVSLLLFWIGYRKTIGVREERIRMANQDIIALLVRRLTIEKAEVSIEALERIRNAKAYQYQVPISSLLSPMQIADQAYTAVTENQFIDKKGKNEIIGRISDSFKAMASREYQPDIQEARVERRNFLLIDKIALLAGFVGIFASAAGLKFLTGLFDQSQSVVPERLEFLMVIGMTTVLIFLALTITLRALRRSKEAQTDQDEGKNYQFIREYETVAAIKEEIRSELSRLSVMNTRYADIVARAGLKRALIEVQTDLEKTDLKVMMNRLQSGIRVRPGSRAFVVSDNVPKQYRKLSTQEIRFVTIGELIGELKSYFQEGRSPPRLKTVSKGDGNKTQAV